MKIKSLLFLIFLTPSLLLLGQSDDSDDSESSSAEASVVSSASTPSVASDGATESNPIVALVRAGIPFTSLLLLLISLLPRSWQKEEWILFGHLPKVSRQVNPLMMY